MGRNGGAAPGPFATRSQLGPLQIEAEVVLLPRGPRPQHEKRTFRLEGLRQVAKRRDGEVAAGFQGIRHQQTQDLGFLDGKPRSRNPVQEQDAAFDRARAGLPPEQAAPGQGREQQDRTQEAPLHAKAEGG